MDYSEATMRKAYALDQTQRRQENTLRQMKQEEQLLRASGMQPEAAKLRLQWRKKQREHQLWCLRHERAYYPYRYVLDESELTNNDKKEGE